MSGTPQKPGLWDADSFVGGALCLDFTNTVGGKDKDRSQNRLCCYEDFLAWAQQAELIDATAAAVLGRSATREPRSAARILAQALALRETLYRLFSASAAGVAVEEVDLDRLNRALLHSLRSTAIAPAREGFVWRWSGAVEDLERPLWPILHSAAALLTGPERALLRECGRCSWLFLDGSKNKRRRWCKMEVCGNRAKAQRRYRRVSGNASG